MLGGHLGGTPSGTVCAIRQAVTLYRVPLYRERSVQGSLATVFKDAGLRFQREFETGYGRIDFAVFDPSGLIGVEVKTANGKAREVWRQLERYALSRALSRIVLVTAGAHRMPERTANGKPVSVISLSEAWI